ncbi:MAG TPA: glycosyltransferase family 4 protein [Bacteroidota bacterium]|nr:glycosyltransferase family 4 protein [Bacteroidota bacterium]
MKILMLARALPAHRKGGVPDHTWMLARGIASRGNDVHILTTRLEGGPPVTVSEGVTSHYLGNTRPDAYDGGWWPESARSTISLHSSERFDLIHCQSSAGYGVVNTGVHRRLRVPAVVSQHGTYYDELVTRWKNGFSPDPSVTVKNIAAIAYILYMIARRDRPYLRLADGVISTSEEQHSLIARVYGVPAERLFKVYNGMDLSLFTPAPGNGELRRRLGIPPSAPLILCVARLIRDKGIQIMLKAMPGILERFPDSRLLVVGAGPYRPRLERLAFRRGLASSVVFAGEKDLGELPEYFRACDIFVNPTNQQNGYDLTMVEAMACEKPVVSSDIGSTPTLITRGIDGVLFPAGNVRGLEHAVNGLLGDGRLRAEIGAKAREKIIARFGLDAMVGGTIGVYELLLGRTGGNSNGGTQR